MTGFTTTDPTFRDVLRVAERAAQASSSVLVLGETGVGKGRMARFLHALGPRSSAPFVEIPCANVPPDLFESEVFGYEEGAFTDARGTRPGRLEQAHRGLLFLDEIQELDVVAQAKLLRVLENRSFERVGGRAPIEVDVHIVASMRESPERLVAEGRLRDDLLYRLDVIRLEIPPLRERPGDVPALAELFLDEIVSRLGRGERRFGRGVLERLAAHSWPGNVRELRHTVERAAVLSDGGEIGPEALPETVAPGSPAMLRAAAERQATLAEVERSYIEEVLRRTRGNKSMAARILGIHRKTLHDKLRAHGGTR